MRRSLSTRPNQATVKSNRGRFRSAHIRAPHTTEHNGQSGGEFRPSRAGRLHRVLQQTRHLQRGERAREARPRGRRHLRIYAASGQALTGRSLQRSQRQVQAACCHRCRRHGAKFKHPASGFLLVEEAADRRENSGRRF